MARLSLQLQYFVNKKISEDSNWRGVQVVLSGHEVPGEGEHKIMEYIRLSKAQKDYNPNTRWVLPIPSNTWMAWSTIYLPLT
jgi:5'-3' exoribonuclease 1